MSPQDLGIEGLKLTISLSLLAVAYFGVYRHAHLDAYGQDLVWLLRLLHLVGLTNLSDEEVERYAILKAGKARKKGKK
jgi:hypothetical protein